MKFLFKKRKKKNIKNLKNLGYYFSKVEIFFEDLMIIIK